MIIFAGHLRSLLKKYLEFFTIIRLKTLLVVLWSVPGHQKSKVLTWGRVGPKKLNNIFKSGQFIFLFFSKKWNFRPLNDKIPQFLWLKWVPQGKISRNRHLDQVSSTYKYFFTFDLRFYSSFFRFRDENAEKAPCLRGFSTFFKISKSFVYLVTKQS